MESWNKLKSFVTPKGISFQTLRSLASLVFKRPNLYWRGLATTNLAEPKDTGLYSTAPVDVKLVPMYTEVVKNKMYLNLIRQKLQNAGLLLEVAREQVQKRSDDIGAAAEMAKLDKCEAKA
ncbi:hypothetical protein BWQ96_05256 [Gracilariopsis chorda]|uniref:Bromo domain-containing protein n=1 Tax=Gracilariopsis chorda TaxID=448386 RepID=A0A2V3ISB0_9FLOR|nr:hypothetical protein BWQ96_05244 [Gracilariopsis chorda]PXF45003.1 hypothetical protein BWQ96_05250 [Gracilariopsis chorda]PXF45006.1 hypothetical protein BWQ96_05253 [Gracilariopsis chorda]PXF45009.1 hypothetical protein BWQ96_05256 [Gracilariopsis chorda]|eukprot:PXF44997.1 hypothetical protein BWQ96_05244 [Gracilariopsis chorda]